MAARLYELAEGSPYWSEIIWEEWKAAYGMGVEQDKNGVWQAVRDEAGSLPIYADVAQEAHDQLHQLLFGWAGMESPYTQAQAEDILQCAATEGERFTVEAVGRITHTQKVFAAIWLRWTNNLVYCNRNQ